MLLHLGSTCCSKMARYWAPVISMSFLRFYCLGCCFFQNLRVVSTELLISFDRPSRQEKVLEDVKKQEDARMLLHEASSRLVRGEARTRDCGTSTSGTARDEATGAWSKVPKNARCAWSPMG